MCTQKNSPARRRETVNKSNVMVMEGSEAISSSMLVRARVFVIMLSMVYL